MKDETRGSGKSWFAEIVASLHGKFGIKNNQSMKSICGDFNLILVNKTLIVMNEMANYNYSKWYNDDALKAYIDGTTFTAEGKGTNAEGDTPNYIDFIFVSNNATPINLCKKERRYMILKPSGKYGTIQGEPNEKYWTDEFYNLNEDETFLTKLYNYFMNIDLKGYNPAKFVKTEAYFELIESSEPRWHEFIGRNYDEFKDGYETEKAYNKYVEWCGKCNFVEDRNLFFNCVKEFMEFEKGRAKGPSGLKRQSIYGKRVNVYKLNEKGLKEFEEFANDVVENQKLPAVENDD